MPKLSLLHRQIYRLEDGLADPTPVYGNNKHAKLMGHLWAARQAGADTLVAVGGAYSNLLPAVAHHGPTAGFKTIGLVRGEEEAIAQNSRIIALQDSEMTVFQLDRLTYRLVCKEGLGALPAHHPVSVLEQTGKLYFLPEGASGPLALPGLVIAATAMIERLMADHPTLFTDLWPPLIVPCGTASTLVGIGLAYYYIGLQHGQSAQTVGYLPFKSQAYADQLLHELLGAAERHREMLEAIYPSPIWSLPLGDVRHSILLCATAGLGKYGQPSEVVKTLSQQFNPPLNPIYAGYALAACDLDYGVLVDTGGYQL